MTPLAQYSADYKTDVRGPLAEPPHEVREPLATEWHVDPDAISRVAQLRLKVPAHAVQHLEFVTIGRDFPGPRELARGFDHDRIVRRNRRKRSTFQEQLH